jgi:four helix bundle protein
MIGRKPVTYDLEVRTFEFAKNVRLFLKYLNYSIANIEDSKQLIRSSGSVGANYIEANESFSQKDFLYRIKISRKEAIESLFWLKLIKETNQNISHEDIDRLIQEAIELRKILSSIITKTSMRQNQ